MQLIVHGEYVDVARVREERDRHARENLPVDLASKRARETDTQGTDLDKAGERE